ncbi:MAG: glycosyltransferase [Sulfurimonas sp.]
MNQKTLTIHQFTPSITLGDGVSNGLFFTQKILKNLGFESEIFANHIDNRLSDKVEHIDNYSPNKDHFLLYHHSIGHEHHEKILSFIDKKILVYHNITPSHFFSSFPHLVEACNLGREQLAFNPQSFIAAYADSPYNAKELISLGYKNVATIPLLLDIEKKKNLFFDEKIVKKYQDTYNILTVGRIVSNKAQHEVINTLFYLKKHYGLKNIKLFLIGGVSEPDYDVYLRELIRNLSLEDVVLLTGKVSDEELQGYYRCADLFLTLSNHEGFCIPLLEAMLEDIPTLAFNTGGISATLPVSSLLNFKSPDYVASKIYEIKNSAHLRHEMIKAQKEHLEQFSNENIIALFKDFLSSFMDIEIPYEIPKQSEKKSTYRIEGPFDSSYSLSIVNQNIALALSEQNDVSLYSTEGHGDFKPNEEYLHLHPEIEALYKTKQDSIDNTIRNLYPPRANAMLGSHKIIGPYGWEESEFLPQFVEQFNSKLTMLFCMSDYVKNVMASNGVKIPLATVGIGADHVLKSSSKPFDFELPKGKKLLHISSCFPRKGVDVLLEVFCTLIEEYPEFTLIIKTFPNPHNNIIELIEKNNFKKTKTLEDDVFLYERSASSLLLINKDLEQSHINYLYENADVFVAPTRGEGFGLPQAEAMLFSLPVVTTAYGGQSDFCTKESAWLVDFEFDYAKTHMNLSRSLWVEPLKQSLLEQLKIVLFASKEELAPKLLVAKEHILSNCTWQHVVQRVQNCIASYDAMKKAKPKVGVISTFNTKCGIAEYTRYLISSFENSSLKIFAPSNDLPIREDDSSVMRCWQSGENSTQDLTLLKDNIMNEQISSLIIQYNFSFFSLSLLEELLLFCKINKIKSYLFIHSAKDVPTPQGTNSFAKIASTLQNATRIMLHSLDDINLLKRYGVYKNTILFAHGYDASLLSQELSKSTIAMKFNISKPLVGSFGFLLPHKGILELIKAAEILHKNGMQIQLLLLNSIHPAPVSGHEKNSIKEYLSASPIKEFVFMYNDFLEDKEILSLLRECRMVVYPYQNTQESSSAAARFGLLSLRPVLTTPLAIFEDIKHVSFQTKGITPNEIAKSIEEILLARHDDSAQREWIFKNDWQNISQRFYNTIEALQ